MLDANTEADFIEGLTAGPGWVLDAGCGTGRVAIELARRGFSTTGVDISTTMLLQARRAAPHLDWRLGDIARVRLNRRYDLVLMAGNVMIFLANGTEGRVLRNMVRHIAPGGLLVTGFYLSMSRLQLEDYDTLARLAGLRLQARYGGWQHEPWTTESSYAVSVHES
ncbi:MAG: methyltransferase domain-containing protein [Chloroflexota bacterium]